MVKWHGCQELQAVLKPRENGRRKLLSGNVVLINQNDEVAFIVFQILASLRGVKNSTRAALKDRTFSPKSSADDHNVIEP